MEFKQFFEIFGMFNYVIPKDKEQQMYDFYMLSLLRGRASSKFSDPMGYGEKPFYEPGNFEPGNLESKEKQADYMLEEVADKLLPHLKKEFLSVISQAVAGEIKDTLYFNDIDILEFLVIKDHPSLASNFGDFIKDLAKIVKPSSYPERRTSSRLILDLIKNHFSNVDEFMGVAKTLFLKADWNEGYGGSNWAKIVDGYFRLKSATNINSLIVAIDHVYDLQHNNGSIFTKVEDYGKELERGRSFGWIKQALDYKRSVKSSKDLLDKVSPSMKKLASRVIHVKKIP
jgi:hypothetical protein